MSPDPTAGPGSEPPAATGRPLIAFRIGIAFLLLNVPLGLFSLALGTIGAGVTHGTIWLWIGGLLYAASWGMLGLGIVLAGPEAARRLRNRWRRGHPGPEHASSGRP